MTDFSGVTVEVRRSTRRQRTVSAFWEQGTAVVAIPAHFTPAQEADWVQKMVPKLQQRGQGRGAGAKRSPRSDDELMQRATELSRQYLGAKAVPSSVRWVSNQNSRWGSATPADGSIRLSDKLQPMPGWVQDYVMVHELAHLLVSSHGPVFWRLVDAYPHTERAKAFLEGVAFAQSRLPA
ncbi:M48 family metallopeptidase [Pseudarthrobacter sp. J1738]|uniref:M48 metallopeptidase family protein n=1 Tax=unclassified Pseudarthrobacter TaxID=2647000 RepID=UPI003D2E646F